ncbi:class I SAM-dependent DNA methyltransferase [Ornithinimicrobium sp. LYQ92]|uniref:class I SAM-dependent DNA methyltransferase n=1 Tax=Serinicoccus sp. LYQ92 TaxID=3378798 RepID=UPI003854B921
MTSSDVWGPDAAARYDESSASMFTPEVLDPTVDLLAGLAGDGRALELAIGTGRVGIPLAERGVPVYGIELSEPMVAQLHRRRPELPVVVGDMAQARVEGTFSLVYLVYNTIGNLRTQEKQVACFANAAQHLEPGGRFVVEVGMPALRRFPPGQRAVPFHVGEQHVGLDLYDTATQQAESHHYSRQPDGTYRHEVLHYRYVWPAELDLMARLAGMTLERRTADWQGTPFTGDSESHVSIWRTPPG